MTKTKGKIKSLKAKYINSKSTDNLNPRYRESPKRSKCVFQLHITCRCSTRDESNKHIKSLEHLTNSMSLWQILLLKKPNQNHISKLNSCFKTTGRRKQRIKIPTFQFLSNQISNSKTDLTSSCLQC